MTDICLPENLKKEIQSSLPAIDSLGSAIEQMNPVIIAMHFHPSSNIPVAIECYRDSLLMTRYTRLALYEAKKNSVFYSQIEKPQNLFLAAFYSRFYIDTASIHLYSAAEHLASALVAHLDYSKDALKGIKRSSRILRLHDFLAQIADQEDLRRKLESVCLSDAWKEFSSYRNNVVHNQPPILRGLGVQYSREKKWRKEGSGYNITFPGNDTPLVSIKEIYETLVGCLSMFVDIFKTNVDCYVDLINANSHKVMGVESGRDGTYPVPSDNA